MGAVQFSLHDHQFVNTVANHVIDRIMRFAEYLENPDVPALRDKMYHGYIRLSLE